MSSQDNKGIPFAHAPDGVGYKLLELPPELVSLLEGENPPTMKLESSPTAGLLKVGDRTYSLRQKNTSNALIVLRTAATEAEISTAASASDNVSENPPPPEVGIHAVATLHETVELLPEAGPVPAATTTAKGKWHEKFGRSR